MKFTMKKLRLNHLELQHYCMYLNGWKMKLNFQILLLYMVKGFVNPYTTIIGWVVKWTMNHYVLNLHFPYVNHRWLQSPPTSESAFPFFTLPLDFIWRTEYHRTAKYEYDRQQGSSNVYCIPSFMVGLYCPRQFGLGQQKQCLRGDNLISSRKTAWLQKITKAFLV